MLRFMQTRFNIVSLDELLCAQRAGEIIPNALVITFDDGIRDMAIDILVEMKIPATFFVMTSLTSPTSNNRLMWRHLLSLIAVRQPVFAEDGWRNIVAADGRFTEPSPKESMFCWSLRVPYSLRDESIDLLAEAAGIDEQEYLLSERPYLTFDEMEQIRSMSDGRIAFGAHTHTHPYIPNLNRSEFDHEVLDSAKLLAERLRIDSVPFAFPFGPPPCEEFMTLIEQDPAISCCFGRFPPPRWNKSPFYWGRTHGQAKNMPQRAFNIIIKDSLVSLFKRLLG